MSTILDASNNGVLGVQPRALIVKCRNAAGAAIAKYDLVRLDIANQTSTEPGLGSSAVGSASNSQFANVIKGPTGKGATTSAIYGVAQEAIADGGIGSIMFSGVTPVTAASATYAAGNQVGIPASGLTAGTVTNASVTQPIGVCAIGGTTVTQITIVLDGNISYGS